LRAGGNSVAVKRTEDYIAKLKEQLQVTQNYRKVFEDINKPVEAPKPSVQVADIEALKKAEKDREKTAKDALDRLKKDQEERIKLGRQFAIEQGEQVQAEIEALQKAEDAQKKKTEAYLEGLVKELRAFEESNQKQRQQLEEIGLTKEELNALTLARLDNTIATEQATLAISNAMGVSYEEISALEQKIALLKEQRDITAQSQVRQAQADTKAEQAKASKEYSETLRTDLKGAFSAAFRDSQEPLKAFGDALENVIFTRASTALAESLADAAAQQFASSAGSGGIGSFLSSLLSFDGGGSTGSGSRTGGLDGKGGFMAMLHPQETVLDNTLGQTSGGGGSVNITQNISIDSRSDQATILQAMTQAKDLAKAEILRSRQRGGAFA
jgi:chromosome segregation ATPase